MEDQVAGVPLPAAPHGSRKRRWLPIGAAFILGSALGFGAAGGETDGSTEPIATQTVEIERTPESCIRALDLAAEGFTLTAEAMGYSQDALEAASTFDVDGIVAATEGMREVTELLNEMRPVVGAASQECRAAA